MADQQKVVLWSIERRHFQKYLERLLPAVSRWRHSFTLNISKYRHNFNGILWIYTRPTQQCHFEWPWDLAKYSMARSDARSLCDSWASCLWQQLLDNVKFIVKNSYSEQISDWTELTVGNVVSTISVSFSTVSHKSIKSSIVICIAGAQYVSFAVQWRETHSVMKWLALAVSGHDHKELAVRTANWSMA